MDRECLALLPRVCEVLADPKQSLPDDTSLEKLLDWLSGLAEDSGDSHSWLKCQPCLTEFLSTVFHNKTTSPSTLSFALRLTGMLAAREDGFRLLQEGSILGVAYNSEGWQEVGLWEDPCVRIGWIQGLRSMLQHRLALHFLVQRGVCLELSELDKQLDISNLEQPPSLILISGVSSCCISVFNVGLTGLTKPLLQLQTDPSLFVASAANQLLAHLVVFFQPMGLPGEEVDRAQADASTDNSPEHLPVAMTMSEAHACVMVTIMDHLEESLTSDQHLQRLQSLRLLGLLLTQAEDPLWGTLLMRVPGFLEPLVQAGHSQLTLQLTDVLLTAYRLPMPDPTICTLLTAILDSQNSSDTVHAAAAMLRKNHRDPVHMFKAISILMLPLEILTGVPLLESNSAGSIMKEQRSRLAEQLNSKSTCVALLSVCLSCSQTLTHTVPDFLSTSTISVIVSVMSLLKICAGHAPSPIRSGKASCSEPIGCNKACGNLIGCSKIQMCALDALANLSSVSGAAVEEVVCLLILYLQNPDSHPTVCKKTYEALLRWLGVCVSSPSVTHLLTEDLLPVLRKRVCDVRWEVRDSTLEFLSHLADVCEGLLGCSITPLLTEALADPESYVRASAIAGLANTLHLSLQQGEPGASVLEQVAIVPRLLEILSQDSEAFPRRAVVQFFITLLKTCSSSFSSWSLATPLQTVLQLGSADLDWEVKVHTLELAELLIEETLLGQRSLPGSNIHPYAMMPTLPAQTTHTSADSMVYGGCGGTDLAPALCRLVQTGVLHVLLDGMSDCDRPVVQKACSVLLTLRCTLFPDGVTATGQAWARDVVRKCLAMRRGRKGCGWPRQTGDSDRLDEAGWEAGDRSGEEGVCGGENVGVCDDAEGVSVCEDVSVCEVLWSLDLEEKQRVVSRSSDYVQNSPLSLLQDILTATKPTEDVIVDCY